MQTEVNEPRGLTFATAARHLLRQDPQVLVIGEIRDQETANIAVRAALTGHLVISTLHAGIMPLGFRTAASALSGRICRHLGSRTGAQPAPRPPGLQTVPWLWLR